MKAEDIKALSDDQLTEKLLNSRKEQMNLRFQKATGNLENPNRWREVRKEVARLKTEESARALASAQATK